MIGIRKKSKHKNELPLSFAFAAQCLTLLICACAAFASTSKDVEYKVVIQNDVKVRMRDGVSLVADIYRPINEATFPVLVERTPYGRKDEAAMAYELATHGYVVVLQDTRGRYDSEGEFYPFRDEANDGFDTIEWAAQQAGVNGKAGMFGGSYVGATQLLSAMARPPHLVAIFPYVTGSEYYEGWTYQSGVLMQWFTSSWSSILATDTVRRRASETLRPKDWIWMLPIENYPIVQLLSADTPAPYFRDWLKHNRDDSYWQQWRVSDHYGDLNVRGLHAAGWHDIFLKGSIKNYTGLHNQNTSAAIRNGQRLVIGPWAHAPTSPEGKIGDVVFGKSAVLDLAFTAIKWFDYTLKGIQNEYASGPPIRLFIMGDNVWRDENEFPLARTKYTNYYLHATQANGQQSDGTLDVTPGQTERPDEFVYDPNKPVPTIGGRMCCGTWLPAGPFDQRPNESRADVLIYSTPPLTKDLEVTGFVSVELYAATSAADTDFTALLADVDPTGYSRFLTDGIVRARYRNSKVEAITPGTVYKYKIDLWATGNVFKKGHRVRLYISSSNFPRFSRNLNGGATEEIASQPVVARQTIYHDDQNRSALILPVVPRE